MNTSVPYLITIFFNFFALYIPHTTLLSNAFTKRHHKVYSLCIALLCVCPLFIRIHNIIFILASFILLFILSKPRTTNLLLALIGYIICVCYNYIFLDLYYKITHVTQAKINLSTKHILIFNTLFFITLYFLLKLLKKALHILGKIDLYTYKRLMISLFMFLFMCVLIFVINFSYEQKQGFPKELTSSNRKLFLLFSLFTAILLFSIILIIQRDAKNRASLKEMEYLKKYTEEIENMYSSVRSFKHDYTNILYSMKNYIDTENAAGLKEYFYGNIIPIIENLDVSAPALEQLSNIKIPELKSILYLKILQAQKYGIKINLEVHWDIDIIKMKPVDITRIMGIFLDNAIEATRTLPIEKRKINVAFIKPTEDISILIENSTLEHTINLVKIQEKNVSSKGNDRGIGLNNVRNILSKYNNTLLHTEHNHNVFLQILEIYS